MLNRKAGAESLLSARQFRSRFGASLAYGVERRQRERILASGRNSHQETR